MTEQNRRRAADSGDKLPRLGNRLTKYLAGALLRLFGWRIEADVPNLPKFVLVGAPHTSNWDFLLAMATVTALGVRISWMGKESMFRGLPGRLFRGLGGVPIRRDTSNGVVEQTIQTFNARDRFVIALMPEGTRKGVREWKRGFYHIAQGAGVPMVMVRFDYGRKRMVVGPTVFPSDDLAADIAKIKAIFEGVRGRHPTPSAI